jgi:hypothetical protein
VRRARERAGERARREQQHRDQHVHVNAVPALAIASTSGCVTNCERNQGETVDGAVGTVVINR